MDKTLISSKCRLFGDTGELKGNVLPVYEDVMKFYEWTRYHLKMQQEHSKEPSFLDIANIVVSRVEEIWQTASIPTVSRTRILQMLKAYHLKCKNLLKSINKLPEERLQSFQAASRVLFDISSCKCQNLDLCGCPKERKVPRKERSFLLDQRTSRQMMIGRIDVSATKSLQKSLKRKQMVQKPSTSASVLVTGDLSVSSSSLEDWDSEDNCLLGSEHNTTLVKQKSCKTSFGLPTLSMTCDRYGVSDRVAAAIASAVLCDVKSDTSIIIDRHMLRRERIKTRKTIERKSFTSDISIIL